MAPSLKPPLWAGYHGALVMSDPKEAPILQTPRQSRYPEVGSAWTTGFLVVRQKPTFLRNLKPVPLYQKETFPLPLTEGPMAAFGAYLHIKAHAGISYLIHISKSLLASKPFLPPPPPETPWGSQASLPPATLLDYLAPATLCSVSSLLAVSPGHIQSAGHVQSTSLCSGLSRCLWLFSHIYNQKLPLTYHVSLYSSTLGSQCLKSAQLHGGKDGIRFSCSQFPLSDFDDQKTKEHC